MVKVKTFLLALDYFPHELEKFQAFLTDKRLTLAEKEILRSWLMLRDGEYEELFSTLNKIQVQDPTVEALRNLLMGIAYINKGEAIKALPELHLSLEHFQKIDLPKFKFTAAFNQFMAYLNLRNVKGMGESLELFETIKPTTPRQEADFYRSHFNYNAVIGNQEKAKTYLKKLESYDKHMSEGQKSFLLTDKFMFYLKVDDHNACEVVLDEMKNYRKFQLKSNYKFMRKLMDFCFKDKPLYLYPTDFQGVEYLYNQVCCLLALHEGDQFKAQKYWNDLKVIAPEVYGTDFHYLGDKCLFQLALNKIQGQGQELAISPVVTVSKTVGDKESVALSILSQGKPVSKEELFKMIWGSEPQTKDELARLRKLISNLRDKVDGEIVSRKGSYLIEKKKAA